MMIRARAESRRQVRLGQPVDQLLAAAAVANQRLDRDDLQSELLGQCKELLAIRAVAVLAEDLNQHAGRLQAGHTGEIDGAFGVSGAPQHAPFLRHQWIKVAGPNEIGRFRLRIDDFVDRARPLGSGYAGAATAMIDRHGEGRLQRGGVLLDDLRQMQPVGHLGQDRHAELPSPVGDHKIDDLGRHFLGGADEIPLVLASRCRPSR